MRFEHEAAPIGIDERVALSAFDLFAGVIAARRFAVERRGHLWKGLIARSRGEVSQILRNGCSDGKFREPAVNQKIKETECRS
jgi:hypothetical protein